MSRKDALAAGLRAQALPAPQGAHVGEPSSGAWKPSAHARHRTCAASGAVPAGHNSQAETPGAGDTEPAAHAIAGTRVEGKGSPGQYAPAGQAEQPRAAVKYCAPGGHAGSRSGGGVLVPLLKVGAVDSTRAPPTAKVATGL
mmetsp:Transcript_89692/g.274592  ORF Transcript_89692/g.274592 Transcript_89692/m.274592 type:complete len:142 (-) Transcript_89692:42-467(-)